MQGMYDWNAAVSAVPYCACAFADSADILIRLVYLIRPGEDFGRPVCNIIYAKPLGIILEIAAQKNPSIDVT